MWLACQIHHVFEMIPTFYNSQVFPDFTLALIAAHWNPQLYHLQHQVNLPSELKPSTLHLQSTWNIHNQPDWYKVDVPNSDNFLSAPTSSKVWNTQF